MNELCVDANVIVKLVLRDEQNRDRAHQLVADSRLMGATLIAPPIFISEVDSIISRRVLEGRLTLAQAQAAYRGLDAAPVQILDPNGLRQRAREIAIHYRQSRVYDSSYAALAELQGCEFWTADRAYFDAVKKDLFYVKLLSTYPLV